MFKTYLDLRSAMQAEPHPDALARVWRGLLAGTMSQPWDGTGLTGHVPYARFRDAYEILREPFAQKGLYVWGAGQGRAAVPQYVGISEKGLGSRFRKRYLASEDVRSAIADRCEINFAEKHAAKLQELNPDFTPTRRRVNLLKYADAGLPLMPGYPTRFPRAERYAKVGLEKLWHYLIPAPKASTKPQLAQLEGQLIQLTNLGLFRAGHAPLLNVSHAKAKHVGYVNEPELDPYLDWLRKLW